MYGLQEMVAHTKPQRDAIESHMDAEGSYVYDIANLYQNQKRSVARELRESLRHIPLQEFLISGLAGASYLVPTKLADVLYTAASPLDIVPAISAKVITNWTGGSVTVDIIDPYSLIATEYRDGAPSRTPTVSQATLTPITFGVPLIAESSMLEDSQFALAEYYVAAAARGMAWLSNDLVLTVLKAGADGVGTVNSGAAAADETTYAQLLLAVAANGDDRFISDVAIITPEAWRHTIAVTAAGIPGVLAKGPVADPFHVRLQQMDVIFSTSPVLHDSADARGAVMTACVSLIFTRQASLLTGRKRWLQVDNYADPVADLAGAVVSARQDSVTLQNDSIYVLTEA